MTLHGFATYPWSEPMTFQSALDERGARRSGFHINVIRPYDASCLRSSVPDGTSPRYAISAGAFANRAKPPISATRMTAVSNWTPRIAWSALTSGYELHVSTRSPTGFRQHASRSRRCGLDAAAKIVDEHSIKRLVIELLNIESIPYTRPIHAGFPLVSAARVEDEIALKPQLRARPLRPLRILARALEIPHRLRGLVRDEDLRQIPAAEEQHLPASLHRDESVFTRSPACLGVSDSAILPRNQSPSFCNARAATQIPSAPPRNSTEHDRPPRASSVAS